MAKKTVKVDLKSAGAEPAAGDVNISYKGTRIAGLSESSTAVLETENTIVQDDIEVEYTKAAPPSTDPIVVFTITGASSVTCNLTPTQIKNLGEDDRAKAVLNGGSGNTKNIFPLVSLNSSSDEGAYIYKYIFIRSISRVSASATRISWSSILCNTYANSITYSAYELDITTA